MFSYINDIDILVLWFILILRHSSMFGLSSRVNTCPSVMNVWLVKQFQYWFRFAYEHSQLRLGSPTIYEFFDFSFFSRQVFHHYSDGLLVSVYPQTSYISRSYPTNVCTERPYPFYFRNP